MTTVGIVGASGYAGGELLRILSLHPHVDVEVATSQGHAGENVFKVHPNLKGIADLTFSGDSPEEAATKVDILFMAVPHGTSNRQIPKLSETGVKIIDMSADFRFRNPADYPVWYGWNHTSPDILEKFVYGMPELHRNELKSCRFVAVPGCIASSAIYSLAPLAKAGLLKEVTVIDAKIGSSGSGNKHSAATHFSERYNSIRIYSPFGHRHIGEIEQELSLLAGSKITVTMSAHSVNMVRGIMTTASVFPEEMPDAAMVWKTYRAMYGNEPFVRFMMDKNGLYRYPDPKLVVGSNFVDLGFALDSHVNRIIAIGSIDNLIKGSAGNAVQSMNIMEGFDEREGLMMAPMRLV
ncbi:MAG: N-acetyl-gamma-glutamyl-phosphate reductase [Candidatus Thermoplasmatota archaeon]|jgi:N-acetyl-gamma-glutamyl-phosphate/LysW-gamma-L-alpha-aminoadipyl-6-phosphate reductase|nr:N-acetyl-gamma-glutamyl-phosphate reductase [Candidatus Thermoplasmatota archaeon]